MDGSRGRCFRHRPKRFSSPGKFCPRQPAAVACKLRQGQLLFRCLSPSAPLSSIHNIAVILTNVSPTNYYKSSNPLHLLNPKPLKMSTPLNPSQYQYQYIQQLDSPTRITMGSQTTQTGFSEYSLDGSPTSVAATVGVYGHNDNLGYGDRRVRLEWQPRQPCPWAHGKPQWQPRLWGRLRSW
ncbi:hypothetical protein H4Q26_000413 [Puccinia striiformis f. sp. tritici PST-130]|nr:hypothetical protein H4Q26_000413 [Puccinia striiformis f. sp. tritici PST-130]